MRQSRVLATAGAAKQKLIRKLLVANRGEIACRVFKTANAMGIRTVAVYCDAERNGKHVQHADEAFRVGPPPASSSYLRGDAIIEICKEHGVDAIHPGYGFLSENAPFAKAVADAGIEFVGPPASAIVAMGSKSESKIIMTAANVPVVPGYHGEDQSDALLAAEAKKIGYPLLIKAVSGGGGKGMKIVKNDAEFLTLLQSARREATNFFKDDRVLLERYIERPRHVEVQVFCDKHGGAVYFFERDCSVQRRHQKVLEEAPAPHLSEELRRRIGAVAVQAAQAVGYVGAGTVEFIFDTETSDFYFMEMNTRLQVEHPVTEEAVRVRGEALDLVRLQLQVAAGAPLGFSQDDVTLCGHCIEARIFAESPREGFLPGSGHLLHVSEPAEGIVGDVKVRVDTGFRSGDDVLVHYDPMIAKLIVWGPDRATALRGLRRALDDYHVVGIPTNIDFCKECCDHPEFAKGGVTTRFIEDNKAALLVVRPVPAHVRAVAAVACVEQRQAASGPGAASSEGAFRIVGAGAASVVFTDPETKEPVAARVEQHRQRTSGTGAGAVSPFAYTVRFADDASQTAHRVVPCTPLKEGNSAYHVDGTQRVECGVVHSEANHALALLLPTGTVSFRLHPLPKGFGDTRVRVSGGATVLAPMPGKVGKHLVAPGTVVAAGQDILIVEAMKMEHLVKSPAAGVVTFTTKEGGMVAADEELAVIAEKK